MGSKHKYFKHMVNKFGHKNIDVQCTVVVFSFCAIIKLTKVPFCVHIPKHIYLSLILNTIKKQIDSSY